MTAPLLQEEATRIAIEEVQKNYGLQAGEVSLSFRLPTALSSTAVATLAAASNRGVVSFTGMEVRELVEQMTAPPRPTFAGVALTGFESWRNGK